MALKSSNGFEKLQYISGNVQGHIQAEGCMQAWGCAYDQGQTSEDPKLTPLTTLAALNKQDMNVKEAMSTEECPKCIQIPSFSKD